MDYRSIKMKGLVIAIFAMFFAFMSCKQDSKNSVEQQEKKVISTAEIPKLELVEANRLMQLPISCIQTEYPNKLNQVIGGDADLKSPQILHPAFYGCFDWHSSVHGHWSLVTLLKQFPDLDQRNEILAMLLENMSEANIQQEVLYFHGVHNKSYERTYGWAWLLKLAEELYSWDDPNARGLEQNLQPLTDLIVEKYLEFLPKLKYPIRVGEHTNTAFGLSFAYDYARTVGHEELKTLIAERARSFYGSDVNCPLSWEPSGFDFLSPCLEEAALMKRILNENEFKSWLTYFLPQLQSDSFDLSPGEVSDRSDGKLVHLDGVNFSRAWCLNTIAEGNSDLNHLNNIANQHINYSLPNLVGDSYEGGHWLGSFAIYALNTVERD